MKSTSLAANNMLEFLDIRSSHISPVIEEGEFPWKVKARPLWVWLLVVAGSRGGRVGAAPDPYGKERAGCTQNRRNPSG